MSATDHPAGENIRCLIQGAKFIEQLDDRLFTEQPDPIFRGGVGGQFRHCIDFYECLLRDLSRRKVDYSTRGRDPRIEVDRAFAASRMREFATELEALSWDDARISLEVLAEVGDGRWSGSSLQRELQFLASHTIHHFALIASILVRLGWKPASEFAEFGIAPSTLSYWRNSESAVG